MFKHYNRSSHPKSLILNIGLNNRHCQVRSSVSQLKQMVRSCCQAFPQTKIYLSKINYSPSLPLEQRLNLDKLNNAMDNLKNPNLIIIDKLQENKFFTAHDHIRWSADTANEFLKFWLDHLN